VRRVLLTLFFLILFTGIAFSANYHVRKGAGGSNNGSDWTNAWDDLGDISGLVAGDTIYIAAGTYTGSLVCTPDGSEGSPITVIRATVASHGSSTGWSDGYDGTATFTPTSDRVFTITGTAWWTFDGETRASFVLSGAGNDEYGFFSTNSGDMNNLIIRSLTVKNFDAFGIVLENYSSGVEIDDCEITNNGDESSWGNVSALYTLGSGLGANSIHNSYIHSPQAGCKCDNLNFMADFDIYDSEIYHDSGNTDSSADNFYLTENNIRVYRNKIHAAGGNQMIYIFTGNNGTKSPTNIHIYNNLLHDGGFPIFLREKNDNGGAHGTISNIRIYGNTIWATTGLVNAYGIFMREATTDGIQDVIIKNNIMHQGGSSGNTRYEIYLEQSGIEADVTADYNYYDSASFGSNIIKIGSTTYAMASPPTGWETNGAEGDPLFTNTGSDDFSLKAQSPAIDSGVSLGTTNDYHKALPANQSWTSSSGGQTQRSDSRWDKGAYRYPKFGMRPLW
jgi:hypothetical protein